MTQSSWKRDKTAADAATWRHW